MRHELSRPVVLARVPSVGRDLVVEAKPEECVALAARLGIEQVGRLRATLRLKPDRRGRIEVTGRLEAAVVQLCVVSLEPVAQEIDVPVALRLLPPEQAASDSPEDAFDDIEAPHGEADLGEALAEELALALDPYPRHPDAELPPEAQTPDSGAFGALSQLRPPKN